MERLTSLPWQDPLWKQLAEWRSRMPHALLLHGARGVGKRHVFKAFAQLLLCESPRGLPSGLPCGQCAGCQLLAADNHPDLRWLVPAAQMPERNDDDGDGNEGGEATAAPKAGRAAGAPKPGREIVIDQVRKISEFLSVSSHRGGRRVVLLMPAEALNAPAANALLKVLEEPPPGTVFLAISDQLDAVLPTIRSRCVLLRAPMPNPLQALAWLRSAGIEQAESKLAEAGGAPMGLAAENSVQSQVLEPAVRELLLALLVRGPQLTGAEIAGGVPKDITVAPAIRLLQRWGWDLLAEGLAGRVRYYPAYQRQLATLARAAEPRRVADWTAALVQTQSSSEHPLNARLVVEGALLGYMAAMRDTRTQGRVHSG